MRQQIDALLDDYTCDQVARILNERGLRTGAGDAFDTAAVQWVRFSAKLDHRIRRRPSLLLAVPWCADERAFGAGVGPPHCLCETTIPRISSNALAPASTAALVRILGSVADWLGHYTELSVAPRELGDRGLGLNRYG